MKKLILFCFDLSLFVVSVFSQTVYHTLALDIEMPEAVQKTIVKEIQYPSSISYIETTNQHFFAYHDGDVNPVATVQINPFLSVNDFVIENDTVFYCGQNENTDCGFVGHFRIDEFFQMTQSYTVTNFPFNASSGHITSFNKMTTYSLNTSRIFAAIGLTQQGVQAVAVIRYQLTGTPTSYLIRELPANSYETFMDIDATDNYIVTCGFTTDGTYMYPSIRIFSKSTPFSTSGIQDNAYIFKPTTNNFMAFYSDQIVLSHYHDDYFSLAAYYWDSISTIKTGAYIGIFSITGDTVSNSSGMITEQYFNNGGWTLRGLTPREGSSHFYLLQNAEVSGYNDLVNLIYEMDNNTFYISVTGSYDSVRVRDGRLLQSIDALSGSIGFVTNGKSDYKPQFMKHYRSLNNATLCHFMKIIKKYSCDLIKEKQKSPFNLMSGAGQNYPVYIGTLIPANTVIDCFE